MLARAAQWNPSIFAYPNSPLPLDQVIPQFLEYAFRYDNHFSNTKYILLQMLENVQSEFGQKVVHAKSHSELAELWGMKASFDELQHQHQILLKKNALPSEDSSSRVSQLNKAEEDEVLC
ncbi:tRNA-dihydrouridine(20) synthase [NAD(P)+]-like [Coelomomyces lativittatus]|nr:tRNA-dihydrouridine(20) synthase [NAD(P)+]-like [Coelomomyces lativittatus]KAJ1507698.1 tRNA-dihydrouridine(20) synthase [NAD(P)+]-like [Coelomomyces lativittatus]KAJ1509902.1 tRNA-dihydrouridine(20) synthase [NAD(P)+]-like [Coelomomyces lativittatus]